MDGALDYWNTNSDSSDTIYHAWMHIKECSVVEKYKKFL